MRIAALTRRILPLLAAALLALAVGSATAGAQSGGTPPTPGAPLPSAGTTAFDGNGMWIWVLPRTERGSLAAVIAKARRFGIRTLFVKSGDGVNAWKQFNPAMVGALHAAGFRVCGWQYVYGRKPLTEAAVSAYAKRQGADCFVIDAESEYEGKYVAADQYVQRLRSLVGSTFPLALAGFPYVHFHPSFPYSVFLGQGAATVNQPQMYWKAIGVSVDRNYATTYTHNRIYQRPIFPLGQTFERAPAAQVRRFRQVGQAYRARGLSWWVWQETTDVQWKALSDPFKALDSTYRPVDAYPNLGVRSKGDEVVWAQQLLYGAGFQGKIDGMFGSATRSQVARFQASRGLPQTGRLDAATWPSLLRFKPVVVRWRPLRRGISAFPARASGRHGVVVAPAPRSATLPAVRDELPPPSQRR